MRINAWEPENQPSPTVLHASEDFEKPICQGKPTDKSRRKTSKNWAGGGQSVSRFPPCGNRRLVSEQRQSNTCDYTFRLQNNRGGLLKLRVLLGGQGRMVKGELGRSRGACLDRAERCGLFLGRREGTDARKEAQNFVAQSAGEAR